MVSSLSQPFFSSSILHQHQNRCYLCNITAPTVKKLTPRKNLDSSICTQSVSRCLPPKNSNSSLETPTEETKPQNLREQVKYSNPGSSARSLIHRLRNEFSSGGLGWEVLSIALPAALALAADPITSLVDTAFVGRLGSVELAAVGVSISVFNLVSKLLNVPLLNITTSFVAEEQALASESNINSLKNGIGTNSASVLQESIGEKQNKKLLPAVSTSLALAAGIGIAEAIALSFGSGFLMNIMGIPVDSPMHAPAEQFLTLRAIGAPPIVIALAAQGAFRGLIDTKTPLYAVSAGNLLNAILDPILIFSCGLGISGAAISTVLSEYLIAFVLLWNLNSRVILVPPNIVVVGVTRYLKSGGLLIGRTIAVLVTLTLATSAAAREGPIIMAGYQISLEVWMALSLLNDALALAGQALLASSYSQGNYERARDVIYRSLQIGLGTGVVLAIVLFAGFDSFSSLFSTDPAVLEIASSSLWFVAGTQPLNAVAFVLDGLYYGVSDFAYAAYSMALIGLVSSLFILVSVPVYGLAGVWMGLFLFMILRVFAGIWRLGSKSGPWKTVWSQIEQKSN
ncbi:protein DETOXIFICATION 44, chloroplastic-like [Papaver somniferum]|uniref:protein DETOXIFICATION 44, chloroplastic-like n=1 Tax=Papaver somniferum TaxID=3469 RepID=UPI000E7038FB|nr:protein DETOXIFICATION 44, chloroplastic-like [Papaver somniferum]XP_026439854.1 protein DETOXIFICATION 44, chloroplastic-like [Papaver somniferum]